MGGDGGAGDGVARQAYMFGELQLTEKSIRQTLPPPQAPLHVLDE